ncbi:hypothetical protein HOY80DRAFT_284716 [Tuber brumale]|nr:hypothetical protein HOY80DRAFT_284716 [Tuber brumale]
MRLHTFLFSSFLFSFLFPLFLFFQFPLFPVFLFRCCVSKVEDNGQGTQGRADEALDTSGRKMPREGKPKKDTQNQSPVGREPTSASTILVQTVFGLRSFFLGGKRGKEWWLGGFDSGGATLGHGAFPPPNSIGLFPFIPPPSTQSPLAQSVLGPNAHPRSPLPHRYDALFFS